MSTYSYCWIYCFHLSVEGRSHCVSKPCQCFVELHPVCSIYWTKNGTVPQRGMNRHRWNACFSPQPLTAVGARSSALLRGEDSGVPKKNVIWPA